MDEPAHKAVVTDRNGVAWQRWGDIWLGIHIPEPGFSLIQSWDWLEGNRGPLTEIPHDVNHTNVYDVVMYEMGYHDDMELTAAGSADLDLVHERTEAVMDFMQMAAGSSLPYKLPPPRHGQGQS